MQEMLNYPFREFMEDYCDYEEMINHMSFRILFEEFGNDLNVSYLQLKRITSAERLRLRLKPTMLSLRVDHEERTMCISGNCSRNPSTRRNSVGVGAFISIDA